MTSQSISNQVRERKWRDYSNIANVFCVFIPTEWEKTIMQNTNAKEEKASCLSCDKMKFSLLLYSVIFRRFRLNELYLFCIGLKVPVVIWESNYKIKLKCRSWKIYFEIKYLCKCSCWFEIYCWKYFVV